MAQVNKRQLDKVDRIFVGRKAHEALGSLLLTVPQKISGNRSQMFASSHIPQCVMLENPETPKNFTGYELPYGKYTDSRSVAEKDYRVIAMISKFMGIHSRHKYIYVVVDDMGVHDIIEMNHFEPLAEGAGYIRPHTQMDMAMPGSIIPKGTVIYRSNNHDDHGNYRFGLNANVAYVSIPETVEDGMVCSESFANRASFFSVEVIDIVLNANDILLNLYGDLESYKSFPDIGESIADGILCAKRRINYSNAASELTNRALSELATTDSVYQGDGYVADIDIFINDPSELDNMPHRTQLKKYYAVLEAYYHQIKEILGPIIKKEKSYTPKLQYVYQRALDFFEIKNNSNDFKWSGANGPFEFGLVRITRIERKTLREGNKLTNRFGGKGVICQVWPDYLMPVDAYGTVADLILSPSGIPARANIGQSYEHELNFCSDRIVGRMKSLNSFDDKVSLLTRYLRDVSMEYGTSFEEWFARQSPMTKHKTIVDIEKRGIFLHQGPFFDNISYEGMKNLYKKYKIRPGKIRMRRRFKERITTIRRPLPDPADQQYEIIPSFEEIPNEVAFDPTHIVDGEEYVKSPFFFDMNAKGDIELLMNQGAEVVPVPKFLYPNTTRFLREKNGTLVREFTSERPVIIAPAYIMVLKHTPESKFSSRSLGTINTLGVPSKNGRSEHDIPYSTTPIKFGDMEIFNALIRVNPKILHRFTASHSTNPKLRVALGTMLLMEDPLELHDIPIDDDDIVDDVPATILAAYQYSIGMEMIDDQ